MILDFNFRFRELGNENNNFSKTGIVEVENDNKWFSISNFRFNYHQTQLICQYFGFAGGYIYQFEFYKKSSFVIFAINCKNGTRKFDDCLIEDIQEMWLNRLQVSSLTLTCYIHEQISYYTFFFYFLNTYNSLFFCKQTYFQSVQAMNFLVKKLSFT